MAAAPGAHGSDRRVRQRDGRGHRHGIFGHVVQKGGAGDHAARLPSRRDRYNPRLRSAGPDAHGKACIATRARCCQRCPMTNEQAAEQARVEARIRGSFAKQGLMATLGAVLGDIAPGAVEIILPASSAVSQQHGFVHAGAVSAIADTAAGYAALSLMPAGHGVLTTEFKINLVAPAVGDRIIARGRVVKAGRTLTLAVAEVFADRGANQKLVAFLTATMMSMQERGDIVD
ncbi:MAG: PaaI family thioesterase [Sphingopyxis sp.]